MTDPSQSPSVHLIDEQSPEGVTTWEVVLDHMDHGVVLHTGEDSNRASEIEFVVGYELGRREDRIRDLEARAKKAERELATVDNAETWMCPECGSTDTSECSHVDDFGSRKCNDCGYVGSPGEDFPLANALLKRLREIEAERDDLAHRAEDMGAELRAIRKLVGLPDGANDDWSTLNLVGQRMHDLEAGCDLIAEKVQRYAFQQINREGSVWDVRNGVESGRIDYLDDAVRDVGGWGEAERLESEIWQRPAEEGESND